MNTGAMEHQMELVNATGINIICKQLEMVKGNKELWPVSVEVLVWSPV